MKKLFERLSPWLLMLPTLAQAQFEYTTNNGTITITKYTGPGGAVSIPGTINGRLVTRIGRTAFYDHTTLTLVVIPNNVTNIEAYAFGYCYTLTSATLGKDVTRLGDYAFSDCWSLTNVCFQGNAPACGTQVFYDDAATVNYLAGSKGWDKTFAGLPASPMHAGAQASHVKISVRAGQNAQAEPGKSTHAK
jgi:hypothetical protein